MTALFSHVSAIVLTIALSLLQTPQSEYRILIKKSEFTLFLYRGQELQKTFPVAIGRSPGDKQRKGDNRTPEGSFVIAQIQDSRAWVHDFNDGKGIIAGAYGPWFLRIRWNGAESSRARQWTSIGIHGTHEPASIGTAATEGCIRMKNNDVEELVRLVRIGTAAEILP